MYDELVKQLKEDKSWVEQGTTQTEHEIAEHIQQAADAIEELTGFVQEAERDRDEYRERLDKANDAIEELQGKAKVLEKLADKWCEAVPKWIPVTERLPESGVHVLLACKTWGGNKYVCDGFHTEKFSQPTEFYEDIDADYSEETDEYYFPEGWWEVIKNWDDYSCVAIEDTVTNWMPLPQPPKEE